MERQRIAVLDATGAHGRRLIGALLNDPLRRFAVRALIPRRDVQAAQALVRAGAEVRPADPDDAASLARAFAGVYGVYAAAGSGPALERARNVAFAADTADVRHLVWSTPEPDGVSVVFGERRLAATVLHTAREWEGLVDGALRRGRRGELALRLPIGARALAGIAAEDVGACAFGVFAWGQITEVESVVGRTIGVAAECLTGAEMARALANALGEPVRHAPTMAVARSRPASGEGDHGRAQHLDSLGEDACVAARSLHGDLTGFAAWASLHRDRLASATRRSAPAAVAA
jgi:uncharacterized protein YbjT (DUF2867 family)